MRSYQIALPDAEKERLISRIESDWESAKSGHQARSERFAKYMQRWEARVSAPKKGDEEKPNHVVPLVQSHVFNKLARSLQSLLGDDAEITAHATGPSDQGKVAKIGRYMTSRVFDQMGITDQLIVHLFRTILFGRSIYFRPWIRKEFEVLEGRQRQRVCYYEGPDFRSIHPDDIMLPPERGVSNIQDFSFTLHRERYTVDELQRGDGTLFQGTSKSDFVKRAIEWANQGGSGNDWTLEARDPVRKETEAGEGVEYGTWTAGRRSIWVWSWYGSWRPLKSKKADGEEGDISQRQPYEADWVVRFIPGMREIVGVQDLLELYPKMKNRRPFGDSALVKDGTYWSPGFGKLLSDIEDEATSNSRLFTAAGELTVWPLIFYKPGSGMKPGAFEYGPKQAIPTEDPGGVNVVQIRPNLDYAVMKQQDTLAMAERVDGITDQSLGRAIDRPTAPRTATGQIALIEEGNVRAYLDATVLKTDMQQFLADVWDLDCDLAPKTQPGLFFRVTEEQARGLFEVSKGGAFMTPEEFGGRYDFKLRFATSVYSKEAQAQKVLNFYQLAIANPLVAMNPRALWVLLNRLAKALGIEDFTNIIPEPPELDRPKTPDEEWNLMLEGDDTVEPNPQDHDDLHLMQHQKQYEEAIKDPNRDQQAINLLIAHVAKTNEQKRSKMLMQVLTSQLMNDLAKNPAGMTPPGQQMLAGAGVPQLPTEQGQGQQIPGMGQAYAEEGSQQFGRNTGASAAPQPQDGML